MGLPLVERLSFGSSQDKIISPTHIIVAPSRITHVTGVGGSQGDLDDAFLSIDDWGRTSQAIVPPPPDNLLLSSSDLEDIKGPLYMAGSTTRYSNIFRGDHNNTVASDLRLIFDKRPTNDSGGVRLSTPDSGFYPSNSFTSTKSSHYLEGFSRGWRMSTSPVSKRVQAFISLVIPPNDPVHDTRSFITEFVALSGDIYTGFTERHVQSPLLTPSSIHVHGSAEATLDSPSTSPT